MHGEEFIADNMIKAGHAVISVDWRSVWLKGEIKCVFFFFFFFFILFLLLLFFMTSAYKNKFSGHMHNFFLRLD